MNSSARLATIIAATALPALALPASVAAHHGWAWTEDAETRLSGTIQTISFGNPHMRLQLRDGSGAVWEVDLSPPIQARPSGFGPDAAKAGDSVTVTGHRARDRDLKAFKGETITVGGKTYDVYPQREKSLRPS